MATVAPQDVRYPADRPFDARRWIEVERLRLVSVNLHSTVLAGVASSALVAFLLRNAAPLALVVGWFTAGLLISLNRYRQLRRFRALSDDEIDLSTWSVRLKVGTALSGIFWGSAGVLLFPSGDLPHQVIILFALAGVSAGAVTSYTPVKGLYYLFVPPTVVPVVVRMAFEGGEIHYVMCLLTLLFIAVVIRSAVEMDKTISSVLKVRAENTLLTQALRHQATHDALVDLVNHREFNARLGQVATSAAKLKVPYALLFVDLDLFKQINDNAGHAAGDETLRRVGRVLKSNIRSDDTAARLGGDEFAILLPRCPRARAEQIADRVLSAIVNLPLEFEGKPFRVGASIGVAYTDAGEHDATAMLRAADAACYAAKNSGRGRVEVHHADPRATESGRFELSKLKQYFPEA
jgi:diguanylate cyclase (GGDEF)-like protein